MDNFRDSLIIRNEITVKSLLIRTLAKWRLILLCGILLATIAGSYSYYKQRKAVLQWKEPTEESTESAGTSIPDYTNVRERTLRAIYDKSNYFNNSLYLRLDPSDFWLATTDVYVITDELEERNTDSQSGIIQDSSIALRNANRILDNYWQYVNHGIDYGVLAEQFNSSSPYIREMVSVGAQDREVVRLVLSTFYNNREGAEKILDFVIEKMQAHQEEVAETFGNHELVFFNKGCRKAVDTSGLSNAVSTKASEFNALMKQYNDLKTNENNLDLSKVKITAKPTISRTKALKLGIAGFIAGIFLSAAIYILFLSMGAKVLSARDFNTVYGLRKIAVIPKVKQKKLGFIDRKIFATELRYQQNSDPDKGFEIADRNIKSILNGEKTVAVVSDLENERIEEIIGRLHEINQEIDYQIVGDLSDPYGEKTFETCDNILAIAEVMKSRYDVFDDLMQELAHSNKNILGSIVV